MSAPEQLDMSGLEKLRLRLVRLGVCDYRPCLERMRQRVDALRRDDSDELWLLEHNPVITTGVRARHLPPACRTVPAGVEVVASDRGGLTTAHNPGQAVAYCLWRLERLHLTAPQLVHRLESCVIASLAHWHVESTTIAGQPGVYTGGRKIASIGLRIRNGWCYHGISVNVSNDLSLFDHFDPCGISGLRVTSLSELGIKSDLGSDINVEIYFDCLLRCIKESFPFDYI
ncbi:MAG: lipoyl(octanoyl) transferase LipB [Gammaproteobacteria bacterium]|nr:lipoyl(octanoyl) transferase LipB [Gammaproteobacteria bacterium]